MSEAQGRPVLLVGSVPLESPSAVFDEVGPKLGGLAKRIPDGETGARKDWIMWQAEVMKRTKGLEPGSTRDLQGRNATWRKRRQIRRQRRIFPLPA